MREADQAGAARRLRSAGDHHLRQRRRRSIASAGSSAGATTTSAAPSSPTPSCERGSARCSVAAGAASTSRACGSARWRSTRSPGRSGSTVGRCRWPARSSACCITLAREPGRVFKRDELMATVWGWSDGGAPSQRTRTLDSHVSRLRRKLSAHGASYVVNVWGVGYRLMDVPRRRRPTARSWSPEVGDLSRRFRQTDGTLPSFRTPPRPAGFARAPLPHCPIPPRPPWASRGCHRPRRGLRCPMRPRWAPNAAVGRLGC